MEVKFKVFAHSTKEIREIFKLIKELEKEHSYNCTLLEVETKGLPEFRTNFQEKK